MTTAQHLIFILFVFAFGACVGSFLNVVVWRLPRGESLVRPPSRCPNCETPLAWYDNVPVLGWLWLRGRCRYCAEPISARYPTVEFVTGALFVFFYWMFFVRHVGPCVSTVMPRTFGPPVVLRQFMTTIHEHWPIYVLLMFMVACLLAISLIDAELFIIPLGIPWLMAAIGIVVHAIVDRPSIPGALNLDPKGIGGGMALGGGVGLLVSIILFQLKVIPMSFAEGEPALEIDKEQAAPEPVEPEGPGAFGKLVDAYRGKPTEKQLQLMKAAKGKPKPKPEAAPEEAMKPPPDYSRADIRKEIGKEMLFLMPPMVLAAVCGALVLYVPAVAKLSQQMLGYHWVSGLLGAVLGALVGGATVWVTRILGTLAFGRVAMGLGDVHLMFGVGAIVGAGQATVAFFLAPFAGLTLGLYMWLTRNKREMPYGPYLSLATCAVLLVYCPLVGYLFHR